MGLYKIVKNEDGSTLAIWEQLESVSRKDKREKERSTVRSLLPVLFGADQHVDHHPNGQPFLPSNPTQISIAHTNRFTVILTHPQKRVGVDIECLDRDFSAVEKKALSKTEQEYLSHEHRSLQLAILWSAKESVYKYLSQDGIDFSRQIAIEKFLPKSHGALFAHFFAENGEKFSFTVNYTTVDNHILTWMVQKS